MPFLTWCPDCGDELRDVGWVECPKCYNEYCRQCYGDHIKYCNENEEDEKS